VQAIKHNSIGGGFATPRIQNVEYDGLVTISGISPRLQLCAHHCVSCFGTAVYLPLCICRCVSAVVYPCWHGIWPDGLCGFRPNAADMRPVAYGPHWPRLPPPASPAPMLRSRASPGSDARHWSPDVILGFAEYALSFPIYIRLSFSLFAL